MAPSLDSWMLPTFEAAVGIVLIHLLWKRTADFILSILLSATNRFNAIDGKGSIPGPLYTLPVGQGAEKLTSPREVSTRWRQSFGPIYRIWNGTWAEIVLTDPKDVETFYTAKVQHSKTMSRTAGSLFRRMLCDAIGLINGHEWRDLRKSLDRFMSFQASKDLTSYISQKALEHIDRLPDRRLSFPNTVIDEKSQRGRFMINAVQALQPYAFFTSAEIFYGELSSGQRDELWDLATRFLEVAHSVVSEGMNRTRFTKWMYSLTGWRALWKFERRWRDFNRKIAQLKGNSTDLPIVQLWQDIHDGNVSEKAILATLTESTFANLDVTTYVVTSCVLLLADNPDVLQELQAEIDASEPDMDKYIERQDTFLHWCFLEGLRLEPIPAFSLPECASEDIVLGGYLIPRGTSITIDAIAINIKNPFWGPDAQQFRPRRFASINATQLRYNISTFGYGSRKCLGRHFGGKMVRALLVHLLRRYTVLLGDGAKECGNFKIDKTSWFALFDVNLELIPREST